MKNIAALNLGFSDAQNYTQRGNKQMLSSVFVRNSYLDDLLKPNIYFLIGEKGTGKTAYAAFLNNNEYNNNKSLLKFINGTDYEKFYELKRTKRIDISGYVDIWKTILLLLLSKSVTENDTIVSLFSKSNLSDLLKAIDEYYNKAFSPEIISAMKIVDSSELAAKLVFKYAELGGAAESSIEFTEQRLQMNLYYICQQFSKALGTLKLSKNITLFIDGIDVPARPVGNFAQGQAVAVVKHEDPLLFRRQFADLLPQDFFLVPTEAFRLRRLLDGRGAVQQRFALCIFKVDRSFPPQVFSVFAQLGNQVAGDVGLDQSVKGTVPDVSFKGEQELQQAGPGDTVTVVAAPGLEEAFFARQGTGDAVGPLQQAVQGVFVAVPHVLQELSEVRLRVPCAVSRPICSFFCCCHVSTPFLGLDVGSPCAGGRHRVLLSLLSGVPSGRRGTLRFTITNGAGDVNIKF